MVKGLHLGTGKVAETRLWSMDGHPYFSQKGWVNKYSSWVMKLRHTKSQIITKVRVDELIKLVLDIIQDKPKILFTEFVKYSRLILFE